MKIIRLGDDCKDTLTCPTIYKTDRGTFVVQGFIVDDPEALATMNLPAGETAVEIPQALGRKVWSDVV